MEIIGEFERYFATSLYPNRVPIAIATIAVVLTLSLVGWRRGWHRTIARHPRRTATIVVPLLVVALPLGWYLGSPLIVSNTIDEPAPIVAVPAADPTSGGEGPGEPRSPLPMSMTGSFVGADEFHFGSGTAVLIETGPGAYAVRLEDLEVRNGPDLFVYLSPAVDGYADGAIEVAPLKADRGNQTYEVPAGVDVSNVRSVVIWCRQFSVLFATAPLT